MIRPPTMRASEVMRDAVARLADARGTAQEPIASRYLACQVVIAKAAHRTRKVPR